MKITQLLQEDKVTLSLEVFPPKKDTAVEQVSRSVREIAALQPDFMSVTYGAGGGTSAYTVQIAKDIKAEYNVPSMAHLTCVSSTKETVKKQLECMQEAGIENVLALRGDIPADAEFPLPDQFHYAVELVRYIKQIAPEMCIGGACYPEGHPEAVSKAQDIQHIKEKVDAGCEFLTTAYFIIICIVCAKRGYWFRLLQGSCRLRVKIKWDAVFNCLAVVFLRDSNPSLTGLEMIRPK